MNGVCVIGLGYVGLPLSCVIAEHSGYKVLGVDINPALVNNLNRGIVHIKEKSVNELFNKGIASKSLRIADKILDDNIGIFIVCVPTPVIKGATSLDYLFSAVDSIIISLKKGNLIIIESTCPPGTLKKIKERIEGRTNFKEGQDFYLAYCPEIIFPTSVIKELITSRRIVSGFSEESIERASRFYGTFSKGEIIKSSVNVTEVCKLFENVCRDIELAIANQLALICDALNISVVEVIDIINTHPRVKVLKPSFGIGGGCIPKDPILLINAIKDSISSVELISSARRVNDGMTPWFAEKIMKALNEGDSVLILGLAYKGNVDDTRNSPSLSLMYILQKKLKVECYDPYVTNAATVGNIKFISDINLIKKKYDAIIFATDHDLFRKDGFEIMERLGAREALIADGHNMFSKDDVLARNFKYIGVGT